MGGYPQDQNMETTVSTERHVERAADVRAKKLVAFVCVQSCDGFFVGFTWGITGEGS